MSDPHATPALLAALSAALAHARSPWQHARLEPLPDKGLAHEHVRLVGTGLLARIPKQSQLGLAPEANLRFQRACFERAFASARTPRLAAVLPVSGWLPRGALLVEEVPGHSARLPGELPAIADALARLHRLPLPEPAAREPLLAPADPLQALWEEIAQQARHLDAAALAPAVRRTISAQLEQLRGQLARTPRPPVRLIAFDSHPGNFLVRADGSAVLVDLEKCRYGAPGLDLAHATLYTSTTWDQGSHAVLSPGEVLAFYEAWEARAEAPLAAAARPWHAPLRRAMWLWSVSWCAKWRVLSDRAPDPLDRGEDWSAQRSSTALVAHVRERVDHYLLEDVVLHLTHEFAALEDALRP
ncbi:phosphotransferase [Ramlibacter rhizophilus]|uniref:Aminoglycoside phosphotransferase family protein n=1 Tax=Ramlibacter rhizophilus TaxID=1781167 RepID=A0A4Z0BQD1_9BURK|nr:phosphotransferase [Ramlibacter rhizophilus]TFZ01051.1 aminoglycoside phosphotransferase family protein [Ramlibacter rhizophilus]